MSTPHSLALRQRPPPFHPPPSGSPLVLPVAEQQPRPLGANAAKCAAEHPNGVEMIWGIHRIWLVIYYFSSMFSIMSIITILTIMNYEYVSYYHDIKLDYNYYM